MAKGRKDDVGKPMHRLKEKPMTRRVRRLRLRRNTDYRVMEACVENGIALGWNRAHKHTDEPSEELLREKMYISVMEMVCEAFNFDDLE